MNRILLTRILKVMAAVLSVLAAAALALWLFNWQFFRKNSNLECSTFIPHDIRLDDGSTYCGSSDHGLPDGNGVVSYPDGSAKAGKWIQGKEFGLFRETNRYGDSFYSIWENGKRIGPAQLSIDTTAYYGIDISRYQDACWGATCIAISPSRNHLSDMETGLWRPVEFVYMKATEGITIYDPLYFHHLKMAKRLKIPHGAYHVMHVNSPARDQARHFLSCVSVLDCDLPPVLDLESQYFHDLLTLTEVRNSLITWLQIVEADIRQKPLIYTSRNFYHYYIEDTELDEYPIWLADYSNRPDRQDIFMRQISSKGVLSGWKSSVDIDKLYKRSIDLSERWH